MARQSGLAEDKIANLCVLDGGGFTDNERVALRFVQEFTVNAKGAAPFFHALANHFTEAEIADIAVFTAWQANGLRTIHSWNAQELVNTPDLPLPYADGPSLFVSSGDEKDRGKTSQPAFTEKHPGLNGWSPANGLPVFPPFDRDIRPDTESIRSSWDVLRTPPRTWLSFLSASPRALWGWAEFHRLTVEEGVLPRDFKLEILTRLAELLEVHSWIQTNSATESVLEKDARLRLGLRYAEDLCGDYLGIDDEDYAALHDHFTAAEVIELGMFVGMQIGSLKLARILNIR